MSLACVEARRTRRALIHCRVCTLICLLPIAMTGVLQPHHGCTQQTLQQLPIFSGSTFNRCECIECIQYVTFYNRVECCSSRAIGAEIRIGSSATYAGNAVCATLNAAPVQTYDCNLIGQYIFIIVPAALAASVPLNFLELQAFSMCTTCSANAALSAAGCECLAGSYQETRILNPPATSRTYSSIFPGEDYRNSLLDDVMLGGVWIANTLDVR